MPLSPKLLETLREYWRWMRPEALLFLATKDGWRADKPITPKVLWEAYGEAAQAAGITKRIYPHLLRHSFATQHFAESTYKQIAWVCRLRRFRATETPERPPGPPERNPVHAPAQSTPVSVGRVLSGHA